MEAQLNFFFLIGIVLDLYALKLIYHSLLIQFSGVLPEFIVIAVAAG